MCDSGQRTQGQSLGSELGGPGEAPSPCDAVSRTHREPSFLICTVNCIPETGRVRRGPIFPLSCEGKLGVALESLQMVTTAMKLNKYRDWHD